MKRNFILILFFFAIANILVAQQKSDVGLIIGTSSYLGDINPKKMFYSPGLSAGAFYRYTINKRYGLRANAYYINLSGSDLDFPEWMHPDRPLTNFNTTLIDLSGHFEFNFLPYLPYVKKWDFTTYVTGGFGYSYILSSTSGAPNHFTLPFGIGLKSTLTDRISWGAEWIIRKGFTDLVDGVDSPIQNYIFHNNDWYSTLCVNITFKFFKFAAKCPVYN